MLCIQHKTSAYYVLRWQRNHKIRHMGLGSARDLSLAAAREKAREQRERIALGTDPLELRRRDREAQRQAEAKRAPRLPPQPGWRQPTANVGRQRTKNKQ